MLFGVFVCLCQPTTQSCIKYMYIYIWCKGKKHKGTFNNLIYLLIIWMQWLQTHIENISVSVAHLKANDDVDDVYGGGDAICIQASSHSSVYNVAQCVHWSAVVPFFFFFFSNWTKYNHSNGSYIVPESLFVQRMSTHNHTHMPYHQFNQSLNMT